MKPVIDHIQITVRDLKLAEAFYDKLMPVLGFDLAQKAKGTVPEHEFDVIEYIHPMLAFGINSPRSAFKDDTIHRRKPGSLHHLAFKADSREPVFRNPLPTISQTNTHKWKKPIVYPLEGCKACAEQ